VAAVEQDSTPVSSARPLLPFTAWSFLSSFFFPHNTFLLLVDSTRTYPDARSFPWLFLPLLIHLSPSRPLPLLIVRNDPVEGTSPSLRKETDTFVLGSPLS